jgi:N-acetylmuramoyl-L-alanine amidase
LQKQHQFIQPFKTPNRSLCTSGPHDRKRNLRNLRNLRIVFAVRYNVRVLRRSTVALVLALTLLASGASLPSAAQAPQTGYRLLSREGTRPLPTVTANNQDYVALDDLVTLFKIAAREDQLAGGITLTVGSRTIIVTPDQPVVSVAGRLVSLTQPPVKQGNRWLLPLDFLSRALGLALDTRIDVRRPSRLVLLGDIRVPRVAGRVETGPASTVVTFDITPPTPARVVVEAGRLVATFEADALDLALPTVSPSDFLQSLQPGDGPASIRLTTGPKFGVHRATTSQPDPSASRLVIELLPPTTETPAPTVPAAPGTPAAPGAPAAPPTPAPGSSDLPLQLPPLAPGVRTLVIDPGHGGGERGAAGAKGTLEKDVTLSIGRKLRGLIERNLGLRVFMTRDDDRLLTLDERSAYANSQKADVFLSIHANGSLRPTVKGAEVYYLSADVTAADGRQQVSSTSTVLATLGGGTRSIDLIPWDAAQARYLNQSATFASLIDQALRPRVEMSPRAVQQAPFRVLVGANMPAVLVEVGYLSNAEQEQALASGGYQDRIAQALFDAISAYRALVERTTAAPAAAPPRTQP